jgi:serine O-acetyltransferase
MNDFLLDIARYKSRGYRGRLIWFNPAVWAIGWYRLGNWLHTRKPFILIRIPLKVISYFGNKWCEVFMEMCIDPQATIGPGFCIGHIGGVHINPGATLGNDCDIAHRVTIGTSAMGRTGAPTLGNNVYVGTGASILGKIKIGDGAKIAANTLVISNIPAGATVMGVPGRIIMRAPKPVEAPALVAAETSDAK